MQTVAIPDAAAVKKRSGATINAYLILRKEGSILLSLRHNTGYCDGCFGLVAGHVEDGEPATAAIVREAKEEANLRLSASSLKPVHLMHRKTNRFNMDVFFECKTWQGEPENLEPAKCAELRFFPVNKLPENLIPYIHRALRETYLEGKFYSEEGW